MDKWNLIRKVAAKSELSQDKVNQVLNAFVSVIVPEVRDNGESITLPGLGTFKQKVNAARKGRNPITGEKIDVAESRTIAFKAQPSVKIKG